MADPELVLVSEARMRAADISKHLFETLVDQHLAGDLKKIDIDWEVRVDEHADPDPIPHVTIGNVPAQNYARRIIGYYRLETDEAVVGSAVEYFEERVARNWFDALNYQRELNELSPVMDDLARSTEAGFYSAALDTVQPDQTIEQVRLVARDMACTAFEAWCKAVADPPKVVDGLAGSLTN